MTNSVADLNLPFHLISFALHLSLEELQLAVILFQTVVDPLQCASRLADCLYPPAGW